MPHRPTPLPSPREWTSPVNHQALIRRPRARWHRTRSAPPTDPTVRGTTHSAPPRRAHQSPRQRAATPTGTARTRGSTVQPSAHTPNPASHSHATRRAHGDTPHELPHTGPSPTLMPRRAPPTQPATAGFAPQLPQSLPEGHRHRLPEPHHGAPPPTRRAAPSTEDHLRDSHQMLAARST
jgi:hypothetical protein